MQWMMRMIGTFVLLVCSITSSGCGARQIQPPSVYQVCDHNVGRTSDGVLYVCAQLNQQTVDAVRRELKPTDTEIILTSGGGPSSVGMDFARLISRRGLTVRARHFCLSACSTYVLMTARRVVVEPETVVAFHHTASFAIEFFADRAGANADDPSRAGTREERDFYKQNGLNPDLLYGFAAAVEPTCAGIRSTPGGPTEREGYVNYRYGWFVPTVAEAEALFLGRLSGAWPGNRQQAESTLRALTGNPGLEVRYGWPANLKIDPAWYARTLPDCGDPL